MREKPWWGNIPKFGKLANVDVHAKPAKDEIIDIE
jgi:hypothetical protein